MMTLLSLLFLSCSHEENSLTRKDGDWDDDIKLSKHEIVFGSDEGSEVIMIKTNAPIADCARRCVR